MRLLLDPARGGEHQGCVGPTGVTEAGATLDLALAVMRLLEGALDVSCTRYDDDHVTVQDRVRKAAQADLTLAIAYDPTPWPHDREEVELRAHPGSAVSWRAGVELAGAFRAHGLTVEFTDNTKHALFVRQPRPVVRFWAGHLLRLETEALVRSGEWTKHIAGIVATGLRAALNCGGREAA